MRIFYYLHQYWSVSINACRIVGAATHDPWKCRGHLATVGCSWESKSENLIARERGRLAARFCFSSRLRVADKSCAWDSGRCARAGSVPDTRTGTFQCAPAFSRVWFRAESPEAPHRLRADRGAAGCARIRPAGNQPASLAGTHERARRPRSRGRSCGPRRRQSQRARPPLLPSGAAASPPGGAGLWRLRWPDAAAGQGVPGPARRPLSGRPGARLCGPAGSTWAVCFVPAASSGASEALSSGGSLWSCWPCLSCCPGAGALVAWASAARSARTGRLGAMK